MRRLLLCALALGVFAARDFCEFHAECGADAVCASFHGTKAFCASTALLETYKADCLRNLGCEFTETCKTFFERGLQQNRCIWAFKHWIPYMD